MQLDKDGLAYTVFIICNQGAKKVIFKACHSGTLKLAYTSPNFISTSPKNIWWTKLISKFFCKIEFLKIIHLPIWKIKNKIN